MNEFLSHFTELWSDPAHFAYEVSVDIVVNTLFLGLLWPVIRRAVRRHDQEVHGTPESEPEVEFMYMDFPDGTLRRAPITWDPTYGFPTTAGLGSPEWEVVKETR